jgi:hypothetical protein
VSIGRVDDDDTLLFESEFLREMDHDQELLYYS